jgi:hypothetical protein
LTHLIVLLSTGSHDGKPPNSNSAAIKGPEIDLVAELGNNDCPLTIESKLALQNKNED